MSYSLFFFAVPMRLQTFDRNDVIQNTVDWLKANFSQRNSERLLAVCRRIVCSDIPAECDITWFDALFAIATANFERIDFESLQELRNPALIEAIGILRTSFESDSRFCLPKGNQHYPCAGFIDNRSLHNFSYNPGGRLDISSIRELSDELGELFGDLRFSKTKTTSFAASIKSVSPALVQELREQFDFLRESLIDDEMDLLLLCMT